jgi:Flp pilus assembly protein protease CpaA
MALQATPTNWTALTMMLVLLVVYSYFDLKERRVSNRVQIAGLVLGVSVTVLSTHLIEYLALHAASLVFMAVVSYTLFRLGAIGGADAKTLLTIALVSPGVELSVWSDPLLEGFVCSGIEAFFMLLLGYLYQNYGRSFEGASKTPLIPCLFIGYLIVQVLFVL